MSLSETTYFYRAAMEIHDKRKRGEELSRIEREEWNHFLEVENRHRTLLKARGSRYEGCTLLNYQATTDEQQSVVGQLCDYAKDPESISCGKNVILFGPKGTGKDHLLMGLAVGCKFANGTNTRWRNGVDLATELRLQAIGKGDDIVDPWHYHEGMDDRNAPVLWISDPLPPTGALSEFVQAALFSIVDERYSNHRPIWMTINVTDGEEAERRMGAQIVDRLRDCALVLHCNWESHRKPQQ